MVPVSILNCMARRVQIIIVLFYSDQIHEKLLQVLLYTERKLAYVRYVNRIVIFDVLIIKGIRSLALIMNKRTKGIHHDYFIKILSVLDSSIVCPHASFAYHLLMLLWWIKPCNSCINIHLLPSRYESLTVISGCEYYSMPWSICIQIYHNTYRAWNQIISVFIPHLHLYDIMNIIPGRTNWHQYLSQSRDSFIKLENNIPNTTGILWLCFKK